MAEMREVNKWARLTIMWLLIAAALVLVGFGIGMIPWERLVADDGDEGKGYGPPNAVVIVYEAGTVDVVMSTTADEEGKYTLDLPSGLYDIRFIYDSPRTEFTLSGVGVD